MPTTTSVMVVGLEAGLTGQSAAGSDGARVGLPGAAEAWPGEALAEGGPIPRPWAGHPFEGLLVALDLLRREDRAGLRRTRPLRPA